MKVAGTRIELVYAAYEATVVPLQLNPQVEEGGFEPPPLAPRASVLPVYTIPRTV